MAASGLEHTIFRPSFVFGRDGGALPTFMRQVKVAPVVTVIGRAAALAADLGRRCRHDLSPSTPGGREPPLRARRPETVDWNGLYRTIAKVLGKRGSSSRPDRARAQRSAADAANPRRAAHADQVSIPGRHNVASNSDAADTFKLRLVPSKTRSAAPPEWGLSLLLRPLAWQHISGMAQLVEQELAADGRSTRTGYAVLNLIGVRGQMRKKKKAVELGMPITTASDVVRRLEGRRLVKVSPEPLLMPARPPLRRRPRGRPRAEKRLARTPTHQSRARASPRRRGKRSHG